MQFGKVLAAATAAASLMTSTAAFAGTATRANTALPQASATAAPVTGVACSCGKLTGLPYLRASTS